MVTDSRLCSSSSRVTLPSTADMNSLMVSAYTAFSVGAVSIHGAPGSSSFSVKLTLRMGGGFVLTAPTNTSPWKGCRTSMPHRSASSWALGFVGRDLSMPTSSV